MMSVDSCSSMLTLHLNRKHELSTFHDMSVNQMYVLNLFGTNFYYTHIFMVIVLLPQRCGKLGTHIFMVIVLLPQR